MKKYQIVLKKILSVMFVFIFTIYTLFGSLLHVKAASYTGRVTADVNIRSLPTTAKNADGSDNKIGEIDSGSIVTVLSNKILGAGCSAGWVNVSYGSLNGYVCSSYVVNATTDPYDRPWTSPKKAIVGGAKFISSSYIAKGQFTSYLKKFNVNPDAYYDQFSHQYMANLAAPSSEALTSYKTYNENKLLSLPLEFSIPVFDEMADSYPRPGGNLIEIKTQDEVTDEVFEKELNKEGFPESYKRILRALHVTHSNWHFKAMPTKVSFSVAVSAEKNVSSIQGGNQYYDLSSGQAISTEKGWYLANDATVAYYLDPRNFLTDKYILQFESLQNSSNYTESVVQSILNNTFMSGVSLMDNQSFASIFVEAGRVANISSVYLASLARQESGTKLGSNTNGATFTYNDIEYTGLFNFFNIGAYSSAANPSKAGLVYASGGYCTKCNIDSKPVIDPSVDVPTIPNEVNNATIIANIGGTIKNNYLVGFNSSVSAASLKALDNSISFNTDYIGTGTIAKLPDGTTYTIVVYGDISGDGVINSADLLKLRRHLIGSEKLNGAYLEASRLTNDNEVNSADLLKLRQHLLGTSTIS